MHIYKCVCMCVIVKAWPQVLYVKQNTRHAAKMSIKHGVKPSASLGIEAAAPSALF